MGFVRRPGRLDCEGGFGNEGGGELGVLGMFGFLRSLSHGGGYGHVWELGWVGVCVCDLLLMSLTSGSGQDVHRL